MSEHTPLTESEWLDLGVVAAQAIRDNLPLDAFGDPKRLRDYSDIWGAAAKNAIRRHLTARTSTATTQPCEACDDCTALVIGPNTDGDPCPWCQTCGCHYLAHAASTATADTACPRCEHPAHGDRCRTVAIDGGPCVCEHAATADTGLRERVEALADEWEGWAKGRSTPRIDAFRDAAEYLRNALAAPASTEDRADNEGTR